VKQKKILLKNGVGWSWEGLGGNILKIVMVFANPKNWGILALQNPTRAQ